MQEIAHISTDLDACKSLIREQARTLLDMQKSKDDLSKENYELRLEISKLMQRLYGQKSERNTDDPNQKILIFGDDDQVTDAVLDAMLDAQKFVQEYTSRRQVTRQKPIRNEQLPAHLERYEVIAPIADADRHCVEHGERIIIGYDVTETLDFERPKLRLRVTKYPKLACANQPQCGIAQPERATGLVEGNRYDSSTAIEIITRKYGYHLPFYRQQDWFAGSGWTPTRSTLLNILVAAEFTLHPLAVYFRQLLVRDSVIGCDDTTVSLVTPTQIPAVKDDASPLDRRRYEVLSEAIANDRPTFTARMWAYRGYRYRSTSLTSR